MTSLRNSYGNNDIDRQQENYNLLMLCKEYWDGLSQMRKTARNNRRMLHGQQWTAAEIDAIMRQGRKPITHNIISQIIANLNGQYLSAKGNPVAVARKPDAANEGKMMSLAIESACKVNDDSMKDDKQFVRLAVSGCICARIDFGYISEKDRDDIITTNINPHTLFFTPLIDDGSIDNIDLIGTINEDSIDGMIVNFAKSSEDAAYIKELYGITRGKDNKDDIIRKRYGTMTSQNSDKIDNIDFLVSADPHTCRYYEVWTKERRLIVRYHDSSNGTTGLTDLSLKEIERINNQRLMQCIENGIPIENAKLINAMQRFEYIWRYKYITPTGYVLKEGNSPFNHQSHPFVLAFYDVMDGQIQPLISNITELQRAINRLYMQADFINGNGAKGAFFYDNEILKSAGITQEDLQEAWTSFNKAVGISVPVGKNMKDMMMQVYSQGNVAPILNMYQNNVNIAQQIVGVNQAIQGQAPTSGTPASRYAQETANAQLNSKPIMATISIYREKKYKKMLSLIQQYYDEEMFMQVAGKENIAYNPDVKDIDYDLTVSQEITTSNYSITEDDKLFQLAMQGFIDPQMYFELSHSGFAKQALELLKQRQQEAQQQTMAMQDIPQESGQGQPSDEQMQQLMAILQQSGEQTPYEEIPQDEENTKRQNIPQYANEDNQTNLLAQFLNA